MLARILLHLLLTLLITQQTWGQSTHVEPRSANNLILCSWNIKWFKDSGRDLTKLAKVIAKFDICGGKLASQIVHRAAIASITEGGKVHHTVVCQRTAKIYHL